MDKSYTYTVCFCLPGGLRAGSATKTAIFQGLSFWMTGRTCLPDQELKRIIVEHGGALSLTQFMLVFTLCCFSCAIHLLYYVVRACVCVNINVRSL